jgi:hypothetical protein
MNAFYGHFGIPHEVSPNLKGFRRNVKRRKIVIRQ